MAEDTARALGANSGDVILIAGKECLVRPLTVKELTEVERVCLKGYKRQFIETYSENADLLGEEEGKQLVREKIDEAARWDVSSLPPKYACDDSKIKVTGTLKQWLKDNIGFSEKDQNGAEIPKQAVEKRLKRLAAYAIDADMLSVDDFTKLTNEPPVRQKVGYVNWWITGTFDGMLTMVWMAVRGGGVTKEDVAAELGKNPTLLSHFAREIERLSAPDAGNG